MGYLKTGGRADDVAAHATPHIQGIRAGRQLYDPVHNSIFEVTFELPKVLSSAFNADDLLLMKQHVTEVGGLDALQKVPAAGAQKFMGVDVSYANPYLDNTFADITVTFNLNLRNSTDNYILKVFKAWQTLSYDIHGGVARALKADYVAPYITIDVANRDGSIWKSVKFYNPFITAFSGLDSLNYTSNDAATIQVVFRADYWDETLF